MTPEEKAILDKAKLDLKKNYNFSTEIEKEMDSMVLNAILIIKHMDNEKDTLQNS